MFEAENNLYEDLDAVEKTNPHDTENLESEIPSYDSELEDID